MSKEALLNTNNKTKSKQATINDEESVYNSPRGLKKDDNFLQGQNIMSDKEKLIDQNIKLKTQIFDLSRQLDEIMGKEQGRKKKYGIKEGEDDQTTKAKKMQLKKQQLEVMSLKNKIQVIKRQLQSVYNNRTLLAKQDELKYLKTQLENLQQQKKSLLKIKQDQTRVLKIIKSQEQYEQKIQELKKQLHSVKQQSKTLNQKLLQSERILRKNHEQYILKQNKVKQLQQKLLNAQTKAKKRKPIQSVTPQMVQQLEQQISGLQQERKQTQKTWHDKINAIDAQLREKKMEQQKKLMLLKEKQKQLKLNELKIKQLRKLIKHNMTENSQPPPQDVDMHQFRYKRNIKYMKQ